MGSRFVVSLIAAFAATLAVLIGAGAAVNYLAVERPRDPFRARSFEFDLAYGWSCERDGTEYVCTPPGPSPHAAIAVIAEKQRGGADNMKAYEEHLSQPKSLERPGATQAKTSEVRYVNRRMLGSKEWLESLHIGSELANYHTYYLATTTSFLGILVTMSVHKDSADIYIAQLRQMMGTLSVYQR